MSFGLAQDLIKWGLPHDVWFHVDALSSAHVYLRLPRGAAWDAIPPETLEDCVTLVKANSIEVPPSAAAIYALDVRKTSRIGKAFYQGSK